jgi:hypothetical protein
MATVGGRQVDNNDLGVMAAGVAALVFSFLPYVGASYKVSGLGGGSVHVNAWHGAALLGLLLLVAAAAVVAVRVFTDVTLPALPVGWHVLVAAAAGLGTLIVLVRGMSYGGDSFSGFGTSVSAGMRWGGYLLVLAGIAETAFAVLALRASGESMSFDRGTPDAPPPDAT